MARHTPPSINTTETAQKTAMQQAASELTEALHTNTGATETIGTQYRKLSRMDVIRGQSLEEAPEIHPVATLRDNSRSIPELARVVSSSLDYYQQKGLDTLPVQKALTHLMNAAPSLQVLKALNEAIEQYQENGWRLSKLIDATSALTAQQVKGHLLTPQLLANFGIAYAWMDMTICNFDRDERPSIIPIVAYCIDGGLSASGIFACCAMIAGTGDKERAEIRLCCNFIQHVLPEEMRSPVLEAIGLSPINSSQLLQFLNQAKSTWGNCHPEAQPLCQKLVASALNHRNLDLTDTLKEFARIASKEHSLIDLELFVRLHHYFGHPDGETKNKVIKPDYLLSDLQDLTERHKRDFLKQDSLGTFPDSSAAMRHLAWLKIKAVNAKLRLLPNTRLDNPDVQIFVKGVEMLAARGLRGMPHIETAFESLKGLRSKLGKEASSQILSDIRNLQERGFDCLELLETYPNFYSRAKSETERKLFLKLFAVAESIEPGSCAEISEIFSESFTFPAQQAQNLLVELSRPDTRYTGPQLMRAARDAAMQGLVSEYLRTPKEQPEKMRRVTDDIEELIGTHLDFKRLTPEVSNRTSKVMHIFSRIKALHPGFIGLAADAESRHAPDNVSMIERMGRCIGTSLSVHALTSEGKSVKAGSILSHVDLKRVFAPDLDRPGDLFHRYKEAWPEYADIIDAASRVNFIPIRNGFWISAPGDSGFNLFYPGDAQPTNYSLVVFNEHYGSVSESAFLVKTSLLQERLSPCLYDSELGSDSEGAADFNQSGLDPHSLRTLNDKDPLAVIDIGSGNNVLFGFATAFDARAPHFAVFHRESVEERYDNTNYGYPDYDGTLRDGYEFYVTSETARDYSLLHNQIASISERGLLYIELYLIMLSQFKKGYVDERPSNTIEETIGSDELSEFQTTVETISVPSLIDPSEERLATRGNLRLLEEARRYHETALAQGSSSKDFRVLGLCDTINLANRPNSAIFLDTETGVLSVDGTEFQLNLDSLDITEEDRKVWEEHVLPKLDSYFSTLRFFRKENLHREDPV